MMTGLGLIHLLSPLLGVVVGDGVGMAVARLLPRVRRGAKLLKLVKRILPHVDREKIPDEERQHLEELERNLSPAQKQALGNFP